MTVDAVATAGAGLARVLSTPRRRVHRAQRHTPGMLDDLDADVVRIASPGGLLGPYLYVLAGGSLSDNVTVHALDLDELARRDGATPGEVADLLCAAFPDSDLDAYAGAPGILTLE